MMKKIELKSRIFKKLQRFSAFSRKSKQILLKSAEIATSFQKSKLFNISKVENAEMFEEIC